jgi:hypothetical protein
MTAPDPAGPFDVLSAITPVSPGSFQVELPAGWAQGRGLFGGLVVAVLTRALEHDADDRPLRSLTAEICGPVQPGPAELRVETLRAGNAVTTATARLVQGGEVQAHAVGVLGRARVADRDRVALVAPAPPPWRDVATMPIRAPLGPEFAQFFEFRPTGPLPFSGGAEAVVAGWVKPQSAGERRDAAYLAACIDAHWPTLFSIESAPRPMATIAFTFQPFARFDGLAPEAPVFHRSRLVAAEDGYVVEDRELWGEDGRLLALNQQTFVVIK